MGIKLHKYYDKNNTKINQIANENEKISFRARLLIKSPKLLECMKISLSHDSPKNICRDCVRL